MHKVIGFSLLIGVLGAAACGGEPAEEDETPTTRKAGISASCTKYFSCVEKIANSSSFGGAQFKQTLEMAKKQYGEGSACWATPETSTQCEKACEQAHQTLKQTFAKECGN